MTADRVAARPRRGRRPGPGTTRDAILEAARNQFGRNGFSATTIRAVAGDVGVDASLVMQLYGSKAELFAAVMSVPADALTRFSAAFEGTPDQLGERVVRAFLDVWEGDPATAAPLMAMLRGAVGSEQASSRLRDFIQERLLVGSVSSLDVPDATLRAGIVASMLVGLVVGRRLVGVPALAEADRDALVAMVGPAVRAVLAPEPAPR